MNKQPWHFIVVRDRDTLRKLGELDRTGPYVAQAPLAVVVAIEESSKFGPSDASRAIQNMMLTAWSEGVGSNWAGWFGLEDVAKLLGVPATHQVLTIIPFGYPASEVGRGKKKRKPLGRGREQRTAMGRAYRSWRAARAIVRSYLTAHLPHRYDRDWSRCGG